MHMPSLVERVASIELFSELTGKESKKVASYITTTDVRQGRDLTVQGTTGRDFMIIVDGGASVRRNGRLVATLSPGDFFGELAVIAGVPRTATAENLMVVDTLNRREFSSLLDESPKLARKILVGAVNRLYELEDGVVC